MQRLDELQLTYPHQLCLPLSEADCQQVWTASQGYSNADSCWNAYLNQLTLRALIEAWSDEDSELPESPSIWLGESLTSSLWEFVNGSIIIANDRRIALIPQMTIETEALYVPQEWVDIPGLAASYYVAVQILPEDGVLRAWGFTTHAQLKQEGEYNALDRTYVLDRDAAMDDLSALWVSLELCPEPLPDILPIPQLSATEAEQLLGTLCQNMEESPRLDVPFPQWAAFFSNQNLRQRLYQLRVEPQGTPEPESLGVMRLSQWFIDRAVEGWQTLEELAANYPVTVLGVRGGPSTPHLKSNPITVADLSQHIQNTLDRPGQEESCRNAIRVLGEIGAESAEAIELLSRIARTAEDEETRWEAAFSLEQLAPNHPAASVRRAKAIELEMELSRRHLAMAVYLMPRVDDKVGVWIQVRAIDDRPQLPPGLSVTIASESGKTKTAQSLLDNGENSELLQIRFQGKPGTRFQAIVSLNEVNVVEEYFLI